MLVVSEEQFFDAAENFLDTDRRGEKTVAAQDPPGDHLTLWFKAVERKDRCLSQVSIRLNLPLKVLSIRTGNIEQNEIGLEPAGGVQGEAIIMFFADKILAGPVQRAPNELSDTGFAINQQDFSREFDDKNGLFPR